MILVQVEIFKDFLQLKIMLNNQQEVEVLKHKEMKHKIVQMVLMLYVNLIIIKPFNNLNLMYNNNNVHFNKDHQ